MNKISTIKKEYLKEEFIKQIDDSYTLNLSMVLLEELEELQQENNQLKERINKAIEYIESKTYQYGDEEQDLYDYDIGFDEVNDLLSLLKGDKE